MLIHRKLTQVIWGGNGGKASEFDSFWPLPFEAMEPEKKVWGMTKEEAQETRDKIMQSHNKVLK